MVKRRPDGLTNRINEYGSFDEGLIPSRGTK